MMDKLRLIKLQGVLWETKDTNLHIYIGYVICQEKNNFLHIHVQKIWIVNWIFEENKIRYVVTHITQVHNQVHTCYQFFEHIFFVFDWES